MEIGLGIDSRFALSGGDHQLIAAEARRLGYESIWTPSGGDRTPFDQCVAWSVAGEIQTGIAVAPLGSWKLEELAQLANATFEACGGRFTLGVGSGRLGGAVIRAMRDARDELAVRDVPVYLGALGPQMLRLAGERYDGAALNWCTLEQIAWSRARVAEGARRAARRPAAVALHEYIRVCVDDDVAAARLAFAKMVMSYALARPGADPTKGYRAHFARMGFAGALDDLERRRDSGAGEDELASRFPDELLRRVGYWGRPEDARAAFETLAAGLDVAVVRLVPARRNDRAAVELAMRACAPSA